MNKLSKTRRREIFLEEFKTLRERAGLSQSELAKRLGLGQDIISRCEAGQRRVEIMEVDQWAEACGSSLLAFVTQLSEHLEREEAAYRILS